MKRAELRHSHVLQVYPSLDFDFNPPLLLPFSIVRSANVPVGFVEPSCRRGPQRSHWMEKISEVTDSRYNVSDQ
jgi:hypothetical protein